MSRAAWYAALAERAAAEGFFEPLGRDHAAVFVNAGDTLLVTFESRQGIQGLSPTGEPLGFEMVRATGWSHLALISEGDTWFRDPELYDLFDRLGDDGFFDTFARVVFYGAGPCGYAAAAFSVAAPGAVVVAVSPQATLDPRLSGWDDRFFEHRAGDFTSRYGYAPEMLDAAAGAFVLYDPREPLDAMHAALFHGPGRTLLRLPFFGDAPQTELLEMGLLFRILARAGAGKLDAGIFARMLRARRDHPPYLRNLLARLELEERVGLIEMLCRNVTARLHAPRFQRRLDDLRAAG
jgi:hypothetical protein